MPAILRLTLAVTTLAVFWLALFVSNAGNTSPAAAPVTATADPAGAAGTPDATAAETEADAARIDSLLVESRDAFASGRYNKLERPADEAATWELFMDRAPLPAEACPAVGNAYRRIGKYDLALKAFERCFDADRKNAELAFFVGLGNEWLTRFGAAEEFYQRAISIATTHFDSEVGLARLRLHRNQLAEALTRASAVLKKSPKHVDALLVAGLAEQRAGHRAEARVHLERAATLSKDYFDVHLALGVLDYSESRFPEARRRFEIANTLDPKRTDEVRVWLERTAKVKATS
jgi:tetratricopeptide (TPR) repeat protein